MASIGVCRKLFISLIGFVVLGIAGPLRAEPACSALDLKGNYSFSEDGTIFIPLGGGALVRVADVEVGTLSFDGRGGMEGQIFRLSFTSDVPIFGGSSTLVLDNVALTAGQYTINSDCTGTATFTVDVGQGPQTRGVHFVLTSKNKFHFISSEPANALKGVAELQRP
jgi:hypothetical protein